MQGISRSRKTLEIFNDLARRSWVAQAFSSDGRWNAWRSSDSLICIISELFRHLHRFIWILMSILVFSCEKNFAKFLLFESFEKTREIISRVQLNWNLKSTETLNQQNPLEGKLKDWPKVRKKRLWFPQLLSSFELFPRDPQIGNIFSPLKPSLRRYLAQHTSLGRANFRAERWNEIQALWAGRHKFQSSARAFNIRTDICTVSKALLRARLFASFFCKLSFEVGANVYSSVIKYAQIETFFRPTIPENKKVWSVLEFYVFPSLLLHEKNSST